MTYATSVERRAGPLACIMMAIARILAQTARMAARQPAAPELTDAQLKDIGVERSAVSPRRPTFEVDGALMRRLMSLS